MFCEDAQEKSQCFCVSSALLHLTHSILPASAYNVDVANLHIYSTDIAVLSFFVVKYYKDFCIVPRQCSFLAIFFWMKKRLP